ncbi:MAG: FGGY family carbohydrate kinase, partial [Ilumatobacteraceae bacterium]
MSVLVIDVGTTGLRAAVVTRDGVVEHLRYEKCAPTSPFPGLVEFDARAMADAVLRVASEVLSLSGPVDGVGITTQRASTVMWDARTMQPLAPGLGWQDLRTVGECIGARAEHGLVLAPNQTATKAKWLLSNTAIDDRSNVRIGTIDSWVAAVLSGGALHVTDHSNAAVTGLFTLDTMDWSPRICELMGVDVEMLPRIVPSSGVVG